MKILNIFMILPVIKNLQPEDSKRNASVPPHPAEASELQVPHLLPPERAKNLSNGTGSLKNSWNMRKFK